jgi:RimJ/RimL family protein N-acetyltransferase
MNIWQGHRVRLRSVEPGDWETHFRWNQESEMSRRIDRVYFPQSTVEAQRWAERAAAQTASDAQFHFEIETLDGTLVGSIGTNHCDARVGSFGYGIGILPEHQRKGYASEAILLVCRYYFQELRYQKVNAVVYSFNEPSIKLHEHLGFQLEGRIRRMVFTQGRHFALLYYGMTSDEFAERYRQALPE